MAVKVKERNGAWWLYIDHKGFRKAKRVGTGKEGKQAAETACKVIAAKLALGETSFLTRPEASNVRRVGEYAEQWLLGVKARRKEGTADRYRRVIERHWYPVLGKETPLGDVKRETIKNALVQWLAAGARTSTVRVRLAALQTCLGQAVEDEIIPKNPAARLGKWIQRSGEAPHRVDPFTRDELRVLLEAVEQDRPAYAPIVWVLARTGLRIGEALTLRWEDFDFDKRLLTVRRTWSGTRTSINPPKGNRDRTVDCSRQLVARLRAYREQCQLEVMAGAPDTGWCFPGEGDGPKSVRVFAQSWTRLLRIAKVRHRRVHDLRHTYASMLLAQGESLAYVRDQLGHASIKITVDLYGHFVPGANQAAVDKLDDAAIEVAAL